MKKKYIRVSKEGYNYVLPLQSFNELSEIINGELGDFVEWEVGDDLVIIIIEMEEKEFESLPEFEGW